MNGLLPPSSSESFLPLPAVALRMMRPTSVLPVNASLSTSRMIHERGARRAVAGENVQHARRESGFGGELGERERGERRELRRLQDHRASRGERRRDLPREHQQREIPRNDLPDDAGAVISGELRLEQLRPAGVMVEVPRDERNVDVARLADALAVVHRLEHGEQPRVALHGARERVQMSRALVSR